MCLDHWISLISHETRYDKSFCRIDSRCKMSFRNRDILQSNRKIDLTFIQKENLKII